MDQAIPRPPEEATSHCVHLWTPDQRHEARADKRNRRPRSDGTLVDLHGPPLMAFTIIIRSCSPSSRSPRTGRDRPEDGFCTMGAVSDWVNMGTPVACAPGCSRWRSRSRASLLLEATGTIDLSARHVSALSHAATSPGALSRRRRPFRHRHDARQRMRQPDAGTNRRRQREIADRADVAARVRVLDDVDAAFRESLPAVDPGDHDRPCAARHADPGSRSIVAGMFGLEPSRTLHLLSRARRVRHARLGVLIARFRGQLRQYLRRRDDRTCGRRGLVSHRRPIGQAWKEYAEMATGIPSRVQAQSFTFISPMGDTLRYLLDPRISR